LAGSFAAGLVLASTAFGGGRTCGTADGISYCAQLGKPGTPVATPPEAR